MNVKIPVGAYPHGLLYGQVGKAPITTTIKTTSNNVSVLTWHLLMLISF